MESRRLKIKTGAWKLSKRVVAYAKRQKNPLYMLGDWLLTLCALVIILVEEIYKFFRYRLNLESFSRFLKEDVRWYRVWIHFTLPFFYRSWFSRLGLLANQDPSGPISIIVCLKACSLAQLSSPRCDL